MPYIEQKDRVDLDALIDVLAARIDVEGEANYAITRLLHQYLRNKGIRYHNFNAVVGILECVKLEFYATMARPYEVEKAKVNGDVGVILELENAMVKNLEETIENLSKRIATLELGNSGG